AQFHRQVMAEVSDPLSHRDHPIWMRLQTLHHEWRAAGGDATKRVTHAWATQASESRPLGERLALAVRGVYRAIFGRIPYVRPGHPYWIDIHPTLELIERTARDKTRAISVFSTSRAVMAPWVKEWFSEVREYRTEDVAGDEPLPDEDRTEPVDFCFVELTREEIMKFRELHRRLRPMVRPGGHIMVLYRTHGVEVLAPRDVSSLVSALPDTDIAVVWYQGGSLTAWLQRQWDERLAGLRKRRRVGAVKFVMTALLGAPLTWLANRAA